MTPYRFHLLALPHTQTTKAYYLDGFVATTIKMARLLKDQGHTVFLYGSEENEAPCDEFIPCISKEIQNAIHAGRPYQYSKQEPQNPLWQIFNDRAVKEIQKRKQPRDFILTIGGASQQPIQAAHQDLMFVEYSIGYLGNFSDYRVFESRAWQHHCYGQQQIAEARFFDTVIPLFYYVDEVPFNPGPTEDYFVYCGRYVDRKGVSIACQAAKLAGVPLKHIGHGDVSLLTYGENLGGIPDDEKFRVMSQAKAVFVPTTYIEPFNQVAVEAQLTGTPVISTDQGGMTETVEHGKTGFRCTYLGEFVDAIGKVGTLDRQYIRDRAVQLYGVETVGAQYQRYWDRLMLLHTPEGWNSLTVV